MGWVITGAVIVGLLGSLFSVAAETKSGVIVFIVLSWVPLAYLIWHLINRSVKREALHKELATELGVLIGMGFDHAEDGTGVLLDTKGKRMTVNIDGMFKTYGYDQIRDVEIVKESINRTRVLSQDMANARAARRNSGLFITVRDVEFPKWRIAMKDEVMQRRWLEMCNQELREGGMARASTANS